MGCEDKEDDGSKWVKHYSSNHQILLVGEGDFSFSSSLAQSFGSASNIVATSLDSYDVVITKYKKAKSNLENLSMLGASTLHGVDATKMKFSTDLKMRKFDRIVFNFPHAGFHGKEDDIRLIDLHKNLVLGFFNNARGMLWPNGEIHVTHKTSEPFCRWDIEQLGWRNSLDLVECVDFKIQDYPGYNNKRGDSIRCDEPFPLGKCSTFKFTFFPASGIRKKSKVMGLNEFSYTRSKLYQETPIQGRYQPNQFNYGNPRFSESNIYAKHVAGDVDYFTDRAKDWDCQSYTVGAFRNQQCQGNPFQMQHKQVSFTPLEHQTELNIKMNEISGCMGAPLTISIRKKTDNPLQSNINPILRQKWKRMVYRYGQHSEGKEGTCDYERSTADARSALKQLVLLYGQQ